MESALESCILIIKHFFFIFRVLIFFFHFLKFLLSFLLSLDAVEHLLKRHIFITHHVGTPLHQLFHLLVGFLTFFLYSFATVIKARLFHIYSWYHII